jgi:hypothetical protein
MIVMVLAVSVCVRGEGIHTNSGNIYNNTISAVLCHLVLEQYFSHGYRLLADFSNFSKNIYISEGSDSDCCVGVIC